MSSKSRVENCSPTLACGSRFDDIVRASAKNLAAPEQIQRGIR